VGIERARDEAIARFANVSAYQIAEAYAWRGEKDQAFQWLERAYQQHDGGLSLIKWDSLVVSLRADIRYAALLRKMNFPETILKEERSYVNGANT
jgi:hypothetical protein